MILGKIITNTILIWTLLARLNYQEQSVYYCESWKKGGREIQEQEFIVNLPLNKTRYRTYIKDKSGEDRYQFTVENIAANGYCDYYVVSLFQYVNHPKIKSFRYPERDNLLQKHFPGPFTCLPETDDDDLAMIISPR